MVVEQVSGSVVLLDPGVVAQHPGNVRDASRGIDELAASIGEVGIVVPLIVVPVDQVDGYDFPDGVTHVAVDGNRRQRAAVKVGAQLPCIVRPDLAAARETATTMAVTGLVRDGFTVAEEVAATQLLLDLGIDEAAIARATARPAERVAHAKAAATLPAELQETAYGIQMDLEGLAAVVEFQDDPDAVARLIATFEARGTVVHEVALLRRKRAVDDLVREATEELAAKGVAVTTKQVGWNLSEPTDLTSLCSPEGKKITALTHKKCPGHAVALHPRSWADPPTVERTFVCLNPKKHGHLRMTDPNTPRPGVSEEMSAEERAAAEAAVAERTARNEARAAWAAARDVRREFLRTVAARKELPRESAAWALGQVVRRDVVFWGFDEDEPAVLAGLLGVDIDDLPRFVATAPVSRHALLLWVQVAATFEESLNADWRLESPELEDAGYFDQLAGLGYTLSEVEQGYTERCREAAARAADLAEAADDDSDGEDDSEDLEPDFDEHPDWAE